MTVKYIKHLVQKMAARGYGLDNKKQKAIEKTLNFSVEDYLAEIEATWVGLDIQQTKAISK